MILLTQLTEPLIQVKEVLSGTASDLLYITSELVNISLLEIVILSFMRQLIFRF